MPNVRNRRRLFVGVVIVLVVAAGVGVGVYYHEAARSGNSRANTVPSASEAGNRSRAALRLKRASCSPSPCSAGVPPSEGDLSSQPPCTPGALGGSSHNLVSVGSISDGSISSCRVYGYYVPRNLIGRAPAIFVAAGTNGFCGTGDGWPDLHFEPLAHDRGYERPGGHLPCQGLQRLELYLRGGTNRLAPSQYRRSGNSGVGAPSDEPYLAAVVKDATSRLNLDAQRLYLTGASAGGSLTLDVACDAMNRSKFRGFEIISSGLQTKVSGSSPVNGTERCGPPGNGAGSNYDGGANSPTDRRFVLIQLQGVLDGSVPFTGVCGTTHCHDSFEQENIFWQKYMGCNPTPSSTLTGSPKAENTIDDYSDCTFGTNAAFESEKVLHGCHSWEGLDARVEPGSTSTCEAGGTTNPTNGFDSAALPGPSSQRGGKR